MAMWWGQVGEGKAHAAIAEVYESVDELDEAVRHMESYLKVAGETDPVTQVPFLCLEMNLECQYPL